MDETHIYQLFALLSSEDPDQCAPLISLAAAEVLARLRPDANPADQRLCFLTAALANLHVAEMEAAGDRQYLTESGSLSMNSQESRRITAARALADAYRVICAPLLRDQGFFFCQTHDHCDYDENRMK